MKDLFKKEIYTRSELADLLRLSKSYQDRNNILSDIPGYLIDKQKLYKREDILSYFNKLNPGYRDY